MRAATVAGVIVTSEVREAMLLDLTLVDDTFMIEPAEVCGPSLVMDRSTMRRIVEAWTEMTA